MFHAARPVVGRCEMSVVSFPYHLKKAVSLNSNLSGDHAPEVFAALAGVSHITVAQILLSKSFSSKSPLSPTATRPEATLQSQSYPLSINTRITREFRTKNEQLFGTANPADLNHLPHAYPQAQPRNPGIKNQPRFSGGRLHFVNPSTHPKCFFLWCVVNH